MSKDSYEVKFKLKNKRSGSVGDTHQMTVHAESETNAIAELRRQHPNHEVLVESLRKR